MAKALLDLTTNVKNASVTIDGKAYELLHPTNLPIHRHLIVERGAPQLGTLMQRIDSLGADESAEMSALLAKVVAAVLDAPPGVTARLSDAHRAQIISAFITMKTAAAAPASSAKPSPARRKRR